MVITGLTEDWAAHRRWYPLAAMLSRHGQLRLSLRGAASVAQSGGMFHTERTITLVELLGDAARTAEIVFSTSRDQAHRQLQADFETPGVLASQPGPARACTGCAA